MVKLRSARRATLAKTILGATATFMLAGCGSSATPSTSTGDSAPVTPAAISSALGCELPPGPGEVQGDGQGVQYRCVGEAATDAYAYFVLFDNQGDEDVYARNGERFATPGAPGGQLQVVGPLWVVWGNHQPTIAAAVNLGGKLG